MNIKCNKCDFQYRVKLNNFFNGKRCSKCRNVYKYTKEERIEQINDRIKRENLPYSFIKFIKFKGRESEILIKCNECSYEWKLKLSKFIGKDSHCPNCIGKRTYSIRERIDQILKIIEEDELPYDLLGFEFINCKDTETSKITANIYCNKHNNNWAVKVSDFVNGKNRCPLCANKSKGEYLISKFLNKHNINYKHNYSFDNCKYKKKLPFDFYLPDLNICIEYDGQQHFSPVKFGGISDDDANKIFESTVIRDEIKTNYCKENDIDLLRIKYCSENELINILTTNLL